MQTRMFSLVLLPVIALVALFSAESAFACSCIPPEENKELLPNSDAAVVGRLVAVTPRGELSADYKYRVRLVVKGPRAIQRGQLLTVRAAQDDAACGLPRGLGRAYGLFLDRAAGRWSSGLCQVVSPEAMREAGRSGTSAAAPPGCDSGP